MEQVAHLIACAADAQMSHDGLMTTVALSFDGEVREPGTLSDSDVVVRRSFLENQLGKNARQRNFRRLLARGGNQEVDALNVVVQAWSEYVQALDDSAVPDAPAP